LTQLPGVVVTNVNSIFGTLTNIFTNSLGQWFTNFTVPGTGATAYTIYIGTTNGNVIAIAVKTNGVINFPSGATFITGNFLADASGFEESAAKFQMGSSGQFLSNLYVRSNNYNGATLFTVLSADGNVRAYNSMFVSGILATSNGVASYAPHTPVAVTVGASPFSYTNTTPVAQECYFSGATAYAVTKMGASVYSSMTGNSYFVLQPTNYCTLTYTVAPTLFTNAW
jgi:hypothetical protein